MVASFRSNGDDAGAHEPPAVREIAAGMSPSIAMLPTAICSSRTRSENRKC